MKKKGIIITVLSVVVIALLAIIIPGIVRSNNYKQAVSYVDHGLFDNAIEKLSSLSGYRDSDNLLDYSLMRKAYSEGDWKKARQYALLIPSFMDSSKYAILCECHTYAEAGNLETAITTSRELEGLDEAEIACHAWQEQYADNTVVYIQRKVDNEEWDSALADIEHALLYCEDQRLNDMMVICTEAIHQRDYDLAISEIQNENFDNAITLLSSVNGFGDSLDLLVHLKQGEQGKKYVAAMFSTETDPHQLAQIYTDIGDYEDAADRASEYNELAKQMDYELAITYMQSSRWKDAKDLLIGLGNYGDSQEMLLLCENGLKEDDYSYAVSLFERKEWTMALLAFEALGDFKDSLVQAKICQQHIIESRYLNAISAYEQNNYTVAYDLFSGLGDYKDSAIYRQWIENGGNEE